MKWGFKAYLGSSKIFKLSGKGRNAARCIQPAMTSLWGILSRNSSDEHWISKNRKWPTYAKYQNSVTLGYDQIKEVASIGEATYNTINISHLNDFQNSNTRTSIMFHIKAIKPLSCVVCGWAYNNLKKEFDYYSLSSTHVAPWK